MLIISPSGMAAGEAAVPEAAADNHASQVSGSMTVIRVTTARVGGVITKVLKKFLGMSSRHCPNASRWKSPHHGGWQQFDVIGDFGESDKQKLLAKLSAWTQSR